MAAPSRTTLTSSGSDAPKKPIGVTPEGSSYYAYYCVYAYYEDCACYDYAYYDKLPLTTH